MAVVALGRVYEFVTNGFDNETADIYVKYINLTGDNGDLPDPENSFVMYQQEITLLSNLQNAVIQGIKDDMESHEIDVGLLDTVVML